MSHPIAEFEDVTKTYRSTFRPARAVDALRGVSLAIEPGEVFAVVGPNRAGKTTLLKILLGLCRSSGGRVSRLGRPVAERNTLARIGYMHENSAFPPYLTATTLLEYYGCLSGIPPTARKVRAADLLDRLGLTDRAAEPIGRFSKGMVQRLALAQCLLTEPDLLVLDEPMEGLDLIGRTMLTETIAHQRRAGKTVLVVSHALDDVARVCDRLAVLVDGRLKFLGPVAALLRAPGTGDVRSIEAALLPIYGS